MRLYHSHVWGYRWPAVCLCSSPLGQLEPSISSPQSPVVSVCPGWPPTQQDPLTGSSGLWLLQGTQFSTSTNMNVVMILYLVSYRAPLTSFVNLSWHSHAADAFLSCVYLLMALAFHSAVAVFTSVMKPLMAINWYTVVSTPRSTCSHRPFSLCRWKALKPIIVLLDGRLPPWTLWHTFKESGLNVFSPDSQWLWHQGYHPPCYTCTHTQLFFLEERVNMCELHCSLELFLVYQKGNWWAWQGTSKGNIKSMNSTTKTFPVYLKRTSWRTLHHRPKKQCKNSQHVFRLLRFDCYVTCVCQNNIFEPVSIISCLPMPLL